MNILKPRFKAVQYASGMSLLELVIVLTLVAILSAYAIPGYQHYIRRGHRSAACTALYRAAQAVERLLEEQTVIDEHTTLPVGLRQSPSDAQAVYLLRLYPQNPTNGGYTLEAEPVETGPMHDDACGSYLLDANGQRSNRIGGEQNTEKIVQCWYGK